MDRLLQLFPGLSKEVNKSIRDYVYGGGGGGNGNVGSNLKIDRIICVNNQTNYIAHNEITSILSLKINGMGQFLNIDYVFQDNRISWISNDFVLDSNDIIEIMYI